MYFSRRGSRSRPRPGTPRLRIQNSGLLYWCLDAKRSIVQNFSSLGARTDDITIGNRRTDKGTISVEPFLIFSYERGKLFVSLPKIKKKIANFNVLHHFISKKHD
jgi:hypothetical protein